MKTELRNWLTIIGGATVCALLIWLGWRLLTVSRETSQLEFFVIGCAVMAGGALIISAAHDKAAGIAAVVLFIIAAYYFARGLGVIEQPLLGKLFGWLSLIGSVIIGYITWKSTQSPSKKQHSKEAVDPDE